MNDRAPAADRSFVLLRAGALRLLLPGTDVGPAEYIAGEPAPAATPGLFECGGPDAGRTVVALSERMRPLDRYPAGRFVLTPLLVDGGAPCFAWDEVRVLIDAQFTPRPLPEALRAPGGPIEGYVEHDGEVLLCTTAQRVLAHIAGAGD